MNTPIAIVDPLPVYQAGLAAVLSSEGYLVEHPLDWQEWAGQNEPRALMITVELPEDEERLRDLLSRNPRLVLVGLTHDPCLDSCLRLLTSGRWTMVDRSAPIPMITRILELALAELTIIPLAIVKTLIAKDNGAEHNGQRGGTTDPHLDDYHLLWLKRLGRGTTVAELSSTIGYSERETYRRLATLYRRLGVSNRSEALVKAARLGMLD